MMMHAESQMVNEARARNEGDALEGIFRPFRAKAASNGRATQGVALGWNVWAPLGGKGLHGPAPNRTAKLVAVAQDSFVIRHSSFVIASAVSC